MEGSLIKEEDYKGARKVLWSVDHSLRQKILRLLEQKKRATVTEIYEALDLDQSVASQMLRKLLNAGLVEFEAIGRNRYYYIVESKLQLINEYAALLCRIKKEEK